MMTHFGGSTCHEGVIVHLDMPYLKTDSYRLELQAPDGPPLVLSMTAREFGALVNHFQRTDDEEALS